MSYSLSQLSEILEGRCIGNGDALIGRVSTPEDASGDSIVVVLDGRVLKDIPDGVSIVGKEEVFYDGRIGISVREPRLAMAVLLGLFQEKATVPAGIDPSAVVHRSAYVDENASIGPLCVLSEGASVSAGAVLRANVFVGKGVSIGEDSVIEPGVVIYRGCSIGKRALIHGNVVIGADGFGHIPASKERRIVKVPQIGGVRICDDVEIGANTSIDRGTIGDTVIGDGTKIDNHIQIGHNVFIGKDCLLAAQVGIAGSAVLEDRVVMAARSGVQDHTRVGSDSVVAALGGVTKDLPSGSLVSGFPARDHRSKLRQDAYTARIGALFDRVKRLERLLSEDS